MKFTAVIATALMASTVIAAPAVERRRAALARRVARRAQKSVGHSNPPIRANSSDINDTIQFGPTTTFSTTDSNWAGAVYTGTGIKGVTATSVNVPAVSAPAGGSSSTSYGGSAWVGIDGSSCAVILQTGIDWTVSNGQTTYAAWYEWYPEASYDFDITVSEGNSINMAVTATSATGGSAVIINESTGQMVSKNFTGQKALCQENAEWIVEDFEEGGSLVPFAAFAPVTFNGAGFTDGSGSNGVSSAQIVNIEQGSKLTSCSTSGSSTVKCSYTG